MRLTVTIDGGEGWIDVKERLKVIDERKMLDFSVEGFDKDGTPRICIGKNAVGKAAARLRAWHLPGQKPIPAGASFEAKVALLDDLYPEVFKPIAEAVSTFEQGQAEKDAAASEAGANPTPDGAIA